ncbi:hypothetical protein GWI33_013379, partial [Rhynchophorus ferrugineus]
NLEKIIKTLGVSRGQIVEIMEDAEPGNMYNLEKEKVEKYHPKQEEEEKEQLVRIMTSVTNGEWSK